MWTIYSSEANTGVGNCNHMVSMNDSFSCDILGIDMTNLTDYDADRIQCMYDSGSVILLVSQLLAISLEVVFHLLVMDILG